MFQSFDEISSPGVVPERVRALRRELKSRKLKGFLVPHSDEHQDEFLPPCAERLRWLTGFTGSAGAAILLENAAALFVDGRYTLQARAQTDTSLFDVLQTPEAKASKWLAAALPKGGIIGYDPNLHTIKEIERLTEGLGKVGIRLEPQADNPIDLLWQDRPAPSSAPVVPHGPEVAGRSASEKIGEVQETLKREKADAVLLTLLDSIAWLFNIRGGDVGGFLDVDLHITEYLRVRGGVRRRRRDRRRPARARARHRRVVRRDTAGGARRRPPARGRAAPPRRPGRARRAREGAPRRHGG